jgi:hypothetical protein
VLIPILFHFQYPNLDYPALLGDTWNRLGLEGSRTAQLRFIFYPDLHPFQVGLSSSLIRGLAQVLQIPTGTAASPEYYIPLYAGAGADYGGTWNSGFFAEAWADFGFLGILIESFVVGVAVKLLETWYRDSPQGPLEKGTYIALCGSIFYITIVSLPTALWTFGLLPTLAVYLVLKRFHNSMAAKSLHSLGSDSHGELIRIGPSHV